MAEQHVNIAEGVEGSADVESAPQRRSRSTIAFPYSDLEDAVKVVTAIGDNGGSHGSMSAVASWTGHETVKSGTFRNKIAAARLFGLVVVEDGTVTLTSLGHELRNPEREAWARATAFRNVPLYDAIFVMYEGRLLPSNVGLESEIEKLGVAKKQTDKARQVLARAAEQSGYFDGGRDRLTTPTVLFREMSRPPGDPDGSASSESGGGDGRANTTVVELRSGGTITLIMDIDLFALSREKGDREFVFELLDQLEAYGRDSGTRNITADGSEPTAAAQEAV